MLFSINIVSLILANAETESKVDTNEVMVDTLNTTEAVESKVDTTEAVESKVDATEAVESNVDATEAVESNLATEAVESKVDATESVKVVEPSLATESVKLADKVSRIGSILNAEQPKHTANPKLDLEEGEESSEKEAASEEKEDLNK